jgi:hypothetical protein
VSSTFINERNPSTAASASATCSSVGVKMFALETGREIVQHADFAGQKTA